MKIDLLRQFVKIVLGEAAVPIGKASQLGLALVTDEESFTYTLYDANFYLELISDVLNDNEMRGEEATRETLVTLHQQRGVKGFMNVSPAMPEDGPCWGAWIVGMAGAEQGFGPLLYDIVMSEKGKLTSDRAMVSGDAANVWKFYHDRRADVTQQPFDDMIDPKTPEPEDDCMLHHDREQLNNAYSLKGAMNAGTLRDNHQKFCKDLVKLVKKFGGKLDAAKVSKRLLIVGEKYFEGKYRQTRRS